jgi:hypothetical protein
MFRVLDIQDSRNQYEDLVYEFPLLNILERKQEHSYNTPSSIAARKSLASSSKKDSRQKNIIIITIRHHTGYPFSTGLTIWGGSEVLAKFIVQNSHLVEDKTCIGVESSSGLCGIVVHRWEQIRSPSQMETLMFSKI